MIPQVAKNIVISDNDPQRYELYQLLNNEKNRDITALNIDAYAALAKLAEYVNSHKTDPRNLIIALRIDHRMLPDIPQLFRLIYLSMDQSADLIITIGSGHTIDDFKGLKMRIPGLGGKVVAKAGGTVVLTPGGEIFTNLERGVIDATEWVGPYHDLRLGLYQAAKYYYYPGFHEPGTYLEYFFNKKTYESLPKDLQHIIDAACMESEAWVLTQFDANNGAALQTLINKHKVQLIKYPDDVLNALRPMAEEVLEEEAAKSPIAKKVNESFKKFQKVVGTWGTVSEKAYYDILQPKYPLEG